MGRGEGWLNAGRSRSTTMSQEPDIKSQRGRRAPAASVMGNCGQCPKISQFNNPEGARLSTSPFTWKAAAKAWANSHFSSGTVIKLHLLQWSGVCDTITELQQFSVNQLFPTIQLRQSVTDAHQHCWGYKQRRRRVICASIQAKLK